ncbi:unnamed protein product [Linum trigynum]|uniref:Uncharacterized protein n=1 Tax=Linum trigynum TaxID=586398 RepID=A0AAV2GMS8_9ROSI
MQRQREEAQGITIWTRKRRRAGGGRVDGAWGLKVWLMATAAEALVDGEQGRLGRRQQGLKPWPMASKGGLSGRRRDMEEIRGRGEWRRSEAAGEQM